MDGRRGRDFDRRQVGNPFDFSAGTGSYFQGLQAGYNLEFALGIVLGVEGDVSFPNTLSGTQSVSLPAGAVAAYEDRLLFSGTLRARAGYAFGPWVVYGTGGWAWADEQLTRTSASSEESRRSFRSGWTGGTGVETAIANNWTAELEYLFTDFGSHAATFAGGTQTFQSDITLQSVHLGLNYQLDGHATAPTTAPAQNWAVHAQTTYLFQNDPPFTSPYVGAHSLIPGQQRETWDATFYVGLRLWRGAELWIDPEFDQGFGLSDTLGVAGFTSGEAYKVGNSYPYARLPRYFVRDTISLGGATQAVEAAANQFAGSQTADRIVLTLGKFGVTDVFDTNKYAHDPRMDFMNWALVDTGAFDYAADAWGRSWARVCTSILKSQEIFLARHRASPLWVTSRRANYAGPIGPGADGSNWADLIIVRMRSATPVQHSFYLVCGHGAVEEIALDFIAT